MLREQRLINDKTGISQASYIALVIWLVLGCSRIAISAEEAPISSVPTSLQLAPIRFNVNSGGNLAYAFHQTTGLNQKTTDQSLGLLVFYGVQARSFIWQPWFARINGGVETNINNGISNITGSSSSKSTAIHIISNLSLQLISGSRFPFTASIYKNNGRQKDGLTANDSSSQAIDVFLSQGYRSLNKKTDASIKFNHSLARNSSLTSNIGASKKDLVSLSIHHEPQLSQLLNVEGDVNRDTRPSDGFRAVFNRLTSSYSYRPNSIFSINSFVNLAKSNFNQNGASNNLNSRQFNSLVNWRSSNARLTVTGNLRLLNTSGDNNGIPSQQDNSTNVFLASSYIFSKGIRAIGSINVTDSLGVQYINTNISLTSTKSFTDITSIAGFIYKRYVSGSLSNSNSASSGSPQTSNTPQTSNNSQHLGLSAGHSLTNNSVILDGSLISNINQVLSSTISSTNTGGSTSQPSTPSSAGNLTNTGGSVSQLATSGSMAWVRIGKVDRSSSKIRFTASDSRSLGGNNTRGALDLFNLQASRNEGLARNQSLTGYITLQKTFQGASATGQKSTTATAAASLSYGHTRVFNISHMTFVSTLRADSSLSSQSEQSFSWENEFNYALGKVKLKLNSRILRIRNVDQTSLGLFATRTF